MGISHDSAATTANKASTKRNALAIFGTLLIIYLITFNGQFTSIDELNLYGMAESLIQTKSVAVPQLNFAAYHNPVGNHEVGFPLVAAPFYWLALQSTRINNIYFVMLLNPLLVAATSAFIFLTARKLEYSNTGSALAAFAYGLGSLGWPYALGFYREPLVGFLWTAGLFGLISWRASGNKWAGGIGAVCILLTPLVKVNIVFTMPFLFLTAVTQKPTWKKRTILLLIAVSVFLLLAFQTLLFLRSGEGWDIFSFLLGTDPLQLLTRIYGQLFSPIKGLIFYMPVVILAVCGLVYLYRKYRFVALGIGLAFVSLVVVLSFYAAWYGGQSWGARMLVPILPVLMIPLASLWDGVHKTAVRSLILIILALSILLQLPVVTSNWWSGYLPFYELNPAPEETVGLSYRYLSLSPPWVLLRNWQPTDLNWLWMQVDYDGYWQHDLRLGLLLAACLIVLILIWKFVRGRYQVYLLLLPIVGAIFVLQLGGGDIAIGYPGMTAETGRIIVEKAQVDADKPYTLLMSSNEFHIYFYEGFLKGDFIHHWLSPHQTTAFGAVMENNKGEWLTLVVDRVHLQPDATGKELEHWLNEQFYRVSGDWIEGYELTRYALWPEEDWAWQPAGAQFGPFQINEFALQTTELSRGNALGIQLQICATDEIPADYRMFVHLLGPAGTVEGLDGPVRYGAVDSEQWQIRDCLTEKRAVYIPPDVLVGNYQLILGAYTPDGPILPANATDDSVTYQVLTTIDVIE